MLPRRFVLRFFELFFRHLWLNLLPLFFLCVAAVVFLLQPIYVSRASIYVQRGTLLDELIQIRIRDDPFSSAQLLTSAQVAAAEFKELTRTDAFAYAVIARSDLSAELNGAPSQVRRVLRLYREALTAEAEGDNLVVISFEAETPALAHQFATATVDAYRSWKISKDVQDGQIAQSFFEEILIPYEEDVAAAQDDLRRYLEDYPEPAVGSRPVEEELQIRQLQNKLALAEQRLKDVLDKAESARLALAQTERDVDQTYKVVDVPIVPPAPEPFYYRALLALVFPAVGLLLAVLIVLGRCAADRTMLNRLDVAEELELPVLAEVGAGRGAPSRKARRQRAAGAPKSDEALPGPVHA